MDFTEFYHLVWKRKPFLWQSEIARAIVNGEWRDTLRLPTASGKTTMIEIWYYALASNVRSGGKRTIPLRLWYVVDRKLLVDDSYEQAVHLRDRLMEVPELKEFVKPVLDHFRITEPLGVYRMRGGIERSEMNSWLTTPNQPTLVNSTVDQYGSRLLLRGYGCGSASRSIYAAMTAIDSLTVIDEAHIVKPFVDLVSGIFKKRIDEKVLDVPKSRLIEISATSNSRSIFQLTEEALGEESLKERSEAKKKIYLVKTDDMVGEMVSSANKLRARGRNVVAVVCNTVKRARQVFSKITGVPKTLMIGRVRGVERHQILKDWKNKVSANRDRSKDKPLVVVCTQTIEVGANFDFDGMVSESAPLDCLTQRFGRLNRLGECEGEGYVIAWKKIIKAKEGEEKKEKEKEKDKDFVYGDKSEETFNWLMERAKESPKNKQRVEKDCIENFSLLKAAPELYADSNFSPSLSDPVVNILAHTMSGTSIDIHQYLHGVSVKPQNEVSVVFRQELNDLNIEEVRRWVAAMPARNHETVNVPVSAFYSGDFGDIEYQAETPGKKNGGKRYVVVVRNRKPKIVRLDRVRTGDTVFLPSKFGRYDDYGWNPSSTEPVRDVYTYGGRSLVLHRNRIKQFDEEVLEDLDKLPDEIERLKEFFDESSDECKFLSRASKENYEIRQVLTPDRRGLILRLVPARGKKKRQVLAAHLKHVGKLAYDYAETIGLSKGLCETLKEAGERHDIGKADPRFQSVLYFPEARGKTLLAKSENNSSMSSPKGWRHELQSLAMLWERYGSMEKRRENRLLLHLVGSHHGWLRPFMNFCRDEFEPFDYDDHAYNLSYCGDFLSSSESFNLVFRSLNVQYGVWGLAFLESILRLADHESSRTCGEQ